MSGYTLASIMIAFFTIGLLLGGFCEWDGNRDTRKALRSALRENEELRQHIYNNNLGNPSARLGN